MVKPTAQGKLLRYMRRLGFPVTRKGQIGLFMAIKFILMGFFASGYQNQLFLPFTRYFAATGQNPWDYFQAHAYLGVEFPYHPLMLYILTPFAGLIGLLDSALDINCAYLTNLIFKLPTFIADGVIAFSLLKLFPDRGKNIIFFYVMSPIIFYACYMHSQLDLIPTALLFLGIQSLKAFDYVKSAVLYGMTLAVKFHVLAVYPLALIYLYRNKGKKAVLGFTGTALAVYLLITAPYFESPGFQEMVFHNSKQANIFEFYATLGSNHIYWVAFILGALLTRFLLYRKINADLLDAYTVLVFSVFLLFIVPSPGWYVWLIPFLSLLLIKHFRKQPAIAIPYNLLCVAYIAYFLFFHPYDFHPLSLLSVPVDTHLSSPLLRNLSFTVLEAMLFCTLLISYNVGVLSNSIYGRTRSIVIGISGDSGAGKSTLLADIQAFLGRQMLDIEGDGDHKWERGDQKWQAYTHLDPKANFLHRQAEAVQLLKTGHAVKRYDYDHHSGRFTEPREIQSQDYIVLSGLHPFYLPKMRKLIDLKIYLDPQETLKHHWKVQRDTAERGHDKEKVLNQIRERQTDAEKYILPQRDFADLVISYHLKEGATASEGESDASDLELSVRVDSSLNMEKMVEALQERGYAVEWDYAEDLSSQFLRLPTPPDHEAILELVDELVPNLYEVTMQAIDWQEGYRGFVQLLILFILSDLKKEKVTDAL